MACIELLQVGCDRSTAPPPDVTPPAVVLATPAGDTIVHVGSLTLSGTIADSVGVRRATYQLNAGTEQDLDITPGTSAAFSGTVTLQPGPNTLRVHAYDAAGNRGSSARVGVMMDTVAPPVLNVTSPRHGAVYTDTSHTAPFFVSGTVSGASRLTFSLNGGPETPLHTFVGRGCGTPCFSMPIQNLRVGTDTMVIAAYNATGSRTVQTIVFEWHVVPKVNLSSPSGSTVLVDPEATIRVVGTARSRAGVKRVTYRIDGGSEQEVSIAPDTAVSLNFRVIVPLGGSRITVNAYDAAGPPGSGSAEVARTRAPSAPGTFSSILPGHTVTCGTSSTGGSYCWGKLPGSSGAPDLPVPARTPGGVAFAQVYAGNESACGLTASGEAYCWGANENGVLGDGTRTSRTVPTRVAGSLRFSSLALGPFHVCGLTSEGVAYCWGINGDGELGNGTRNASSVPIAVAGDARFGTITAGTGQTCALTPSGQPYCWGRNLLRSGPSTVPVAVPGGQTFAAISAGGAVACALTPGGEAFCWGNFGFVTQPGIPNAVPGGLTFTSIGTGGLHACGVTGSGAGYCWGRGIAGEIGTGFDDNSVPAPISGGLGFIRLQLSTSHTCGLAQNAAAYCWGHGIHGQLGNGTHFNTTGPVRVLDPS
ncbi:MAG: hypothetical protein KY464_02080 [Gemmatimonadetes bacterium]|nr:hypothetical protein [Gemmatimonadota bacterium]